MSSPSGLRTRRSSRFIEGSEATGPDVLQRSQTSNELLLTILSEMDAMESKQKPTGRKHAHRASSSSLESFASASSSRSKDSPRPKEREWRRSFTLGRMSMDRPVEPVGHGNGEGEQGNFANKFKGRLRALTGGVKPYPAP